MIVQILLTKIQASRDSCI